MMRMRTKNDVSPPLMNDGVRGSCADEKKWELRPGGMLVQKRTDEEHTRVPPPNMRVRVKYGSTYNEIRISSEATFGELKKMLSGPTRLHHEGQKLFYKGKERDSKAFLDNAGVKDKSKLVLHEDPISQEKRYIEMRKNAKIEKSAKSISEISLAVDNVAAQVSTLESVISKGGKVEEKDVITLIELLMNQLLKLDIIVVDGDVKLQRKMQVRRVQKYVETLDLLKLKIKNRTQQQRPSIGNITSPVQPQMYPNGSVSSPDRPQRHSNGSVSSPVQPERHLLRHSLIDSPRHSVSGAAVVITTHWEMFDSAPRAMPGGASTSRTSHPAAQPSFTWDLL